MVARIVQRLLEYLILDQSQLMARNKPFLDFMSRRFNVSYDVLSRGFLLFLSGSFSYIVFTYLSTEEHKKTLVTKRMPCNVMKCFFSGLYASVTGLAYSLLDKRDEAKSNNQKRMAWTGILRCVVALVGTYHASFVSFQL